MKWQTFWHSPPWLCTWTHHGARERLSACVTRAGWSWLTGFSGGGRRSEERTVKVVAVSGCSDPLRLLLWQQVFGHGERKARASSSSLDARSVSSPDPRHLMDPEWEVWRRGCEGGLTQTSLFLFCIFLQFVVMVLLDQSVNYILLLSIFLS